METTNEPLTLADLLQAQPAVLPQAAKLLAHQLYVPSFALFRSCTHSLECSSALHEIYGFGKACAPKGPMSNTKSDETAVLHAEGGDRTRTRCEPHWSLSSSASASSATSAPRPRERKPL